MTYINFQNKKIMLKSARSGKLRTLVKGFIILELGTVRFRLCLDFPHGFVQFLSNGTVQ
jgi:hypothetical protein